MELRQSLWTADGGWREISGVEASADNFDLVFYFAGPGVLTDGTLFDTLKVRYPGARLIGCTTGGEILGEEVYDGSLAVTALRFADTPLATATETIDQTDRSFAVGKRLGESLAAPDLKAVFVLSDGVGVNGSELVRGLGAALGEGVILTGGLAGDGADFGTTLVGLDELPQPGRICAVGFRGDKVRIGTGSFGGWDAFGPTRIVSRSAGNVLFELDGEPALDLYKRYLGEEEIEGLPGSALLFPLRIRANAADEGDLVRTVVGIDEARKAMIFAGDVPQGYAAQLMRGNFDHLISGAAEAAEQVAQATGPSLALLVSCIGRKLLLGQRSAEEVEAVAEVLGTGCAVTGFYSYGEISPHNQTGLCELHNQTMTVTVIGEA